MRLPLSRHDLRWLSIQVSDYLNKAFSITEDNKKIDLPYPVNPIEWVASEKFLNLSAIYDMRGQYYALREFFQCYCPICSSFSSKDVFTIDKSKLLKDNLLVWDNNKMDEFCPKCGLLKRDFIKEGLLKEYNVLVGAIGMRAGKTTLAGMIMSYVEVFFNRLGDIRRALGLESVPYIEIGCIAVSAQQAKGTIWAQFGSIRDNSIWYERFREYMNDSGYVKDGLYEELGSSVRNDVVGYHIESMNSSSASLAGKTRGLFIIDELSRFDTTESKRSASEVWRVGLHSLKTVRKAVKDMGLPGWVGSLVAIGSPLSVDDYLMMKLKDESGDSVLKMHYSTWEFNRLYKESDFVQEFEDDYIAAVRDFGAEPPGSDVPFFENWDMIVELVEDKGLKPVVDFDGIERIGYGGVVYIGKVVKDIRFDDGEWFIGCDAGKSRDSFGIVGCKRIWDKSGGFSLVCGFVVHILPDAVARRYVDYECIPLLLEVICKRLKVLKISFDYWNSESIVQHLELKGLPVEQYAMSALKVDDFLSFRGGLLSGRVKLLPRLRSEDSDSRLMDSQTRLYWEMKRMRRSRDLAKVDHSPRSTSDLFECLVNCWRMASSNIDIGRNFESFNNFGDIIRIRKW